MNLPRPFANNSPRDGVPFCRGFVSRASRIGFVLSPPFGSFGESLRRSQSPNWVRFVTTIRFVRGIDPSCPIVELGSFYHRHSVRSGNRSVVLNRRIGFVLSPPFGSFGEWALVHWARRVLSNCQGASRSRSGSLLILTIEAAAPLVPRFSRSGLGIVGRFSRRLADLHRFLGTTGRLRPVSSGPDRSEVIADDQWHTGSDITSS